MLGISKVFSEMSDIDQAALIEIIAGKQRGNSITALLTSMSQAENVLATSLESSGSAMKEHETWMDSIQAKQQQLTAQYQVFANTFMNSELIKGTFDAGTGILGLLTKLVDTFGALPALIAAITPFFNKLQLLQTTKFKDGKSGNLFGSGLGITTSGKANKLSFENDIKLLEQYNQGIANLTDATNNDAQRRLLWIKTIGQGSDELKYAIDVNDKATISAEEYTKATEASTVATTGLGIAAKVATVAVRFLKTAFNMVIGFAAGAIISYLANQFYELANAEQIAANEAQEIAGRTAETSAKISSEIETLDQLIARYKELAESEQWDSSTRIEIKDIQTQITELVGDQANNLDLVNGRLDDQLSKLYKIAIAEKEAALSSYVTDANAQKATRDSYIGNKEKSELKKGGYYESAYHSDIGSFGKNKHVVYYKDFDLDENKVIADLISSLDLEGLFYRTSGNTLRIGIEYYRENDDGEIEYILGTAQQQADAFKQIYQAIEDAGLSTDSDVFTFFQSTAEGWQEIIKSADEAEEKIASTVLDIAKIQSRDLKVDSLSDIKAYSDSLRDTMMDYDQYVAMFESKSEALAKAEGYINDSIFEQFGDLFKFPEFDMSGSTKEYIDQVNAVVAEMSEASGISETAIKLRFGFADSVDEASGEAIDYYESIANEIAQNTIEIPLDGLGLNTSDAAANDYRDEIINSFMPKDLQAAIKDNIAESIRNIDIEAYRDEILNSLSPDDLQIAYDAMVNQGVTSWKKLIEVVEEYKSEQATAANEVNTFKEKISDLWGSEGFSDTKDSLVEMAGTINGITAQNIKEVAADSKGLQEILAQDGMDAQFLAKVLNTMANGGDGLSLITEKALKLNAALFNMSDEFDSVINAKSRYDAAMSVEEKDANFRSYADAFSELNEQFEEGTTNSNAFWAAAEYLFGEEQLAAWGWSEGLDNIYAAMQKNKLIFEDADSAGAGFVDRLYRMSEAGELLNESGENLLEISKLADGSYKFDIDESNLDAIAEKMGITKDAIVACFQALSMWGDVDFNNTEEVSRTIEEIGLSAEVAGKKAIDVEGLTVQLKNLGKTGKEIADIKTDLAELDGVVLLDVSADVDELTQSLVELGLAADDGVTISVNYEGLSDLLVNLGFTKDEAEALITKLGEADGITLTNANGGVATVNEALEHLDTLTFAEVSTRLDEFGTTANTAADKVKDTATEVKNLDNQKLTNVTGQFNTLKTAANRTASSVKDVQTAVQNLDGTTATVTVSQKTESEYASGTKGAKGGLSLVGEEGTELVQSGHYAYLVGMNGAEIVNLNRGDKVFNNTDTRRILGTASRGHITGVIPAYLSGTVNTNKNKTGSTGTPRGASGSDSNSKSSSSDTPWADELKYYQHLRTMELITDKEYYDKLNEYLDTYYNNRESYIDDYRSLLEEAFALARTLADDWFNDMEHKIFLMENNGVSEHEQLNIYKEMQTEAHRLAAEARAYGLDENSDYIQSLQKQWWDYQDAIEELYNKIYESEQKERENTLELLDNQYNTLAGNREYSAMNTNLEQQLAMQKAIQKAAHEEAKRLRALGVEENDESIQACINTWWDAYDKIQTINGKIVDNVLGVYDEFIKYADDFNMWSDFDFTKVDYLKTKLNALNRLWEQGVLTLEEYNMYMIN